MIDWRDNLLEDDDAIAALVRGMRRVAVLGIKTEAQAGQPAFDVPAYLARAGLEVVPVPVYYPEVTEILGQPVFRRVRDVPGPVDVVDVFRRSSDVPGHLDDLLGARPKAVWMQSGIAHREVAEQLARAGIQVVQNRCLMVDHATFARRR